MLKHCPDMPLLSTGETLPYASNVLAAEIILLFLLGIVEALRLFFGEFHIIMMDLFSLRLLCILWKAWCYKVVTWSHFCKCLSLLYMLFTIIITWWSLQWISSLSRCKKTIYWLIVEKHVKWLQTFTNMRLSNFSHQKLL